MRFSVLILLLFIPFAASAQNTTNAQLQDKGILIRDIEMQGFTLGDKNQFIKLFKPYRNKYLTTSDMDGILKKIQIIYEREGYQELVSVSYQVTRHRLIYTVLMTS